MIFQNQHHLNCVLIFIFFGLIVGLVSIIYFCFFALNFRKKIIKSILNAIFYAFFSTFFIFLINLFNFGHFSLTLLCLYFLGFYTARKSLKNLVVILEAKWYNSIKGFAENFKTQNTKRKLKENDSPKKS